MAIRLGAQTTDTPPPLMNLPVINKHDCEHDHSTDASHPNEQAHYEPSVTVSTPSYDNYPFLSSFEDYVIIPLSSASATATTCPNSDFSSGIAAPWVGCFGRFDNPCSKPGFLFAPNPPNSLVPLHKSIIGPGWPDPQTNGGLMSVFPGEFSSARLGDTAYTGGTDKAAILKYDISLNPNTYFFIYRYAIVLQSGGHFGNQQPDFEVKLTDLNDIELDHTCGTYYYAAPTSSPVPLPNGWHQIGSGGEGTVYWKEWSTVGMDLQKYSESPYNLSEVRITFKVRGCTYNTHYGYAYISTSCGSMHITQAGCAGSNQVVLQAPPGFATCTWTGPICSTCTPTATIGQTRTIINANVGDTYRLDLIAQNGCVVKQVMTTLQFTTIEPSFSSFVGCVGFPSSFIDNSVINQNATDDRIWNFGDGTATVTVQTGTVSHTYTTSGTFVVSLTRTTTDPCSKTITSLVSVTASPPEFSSPVLPERSICSGDHIAIPVTVTPTTATVYWTSSVISGTVSITTNPVNPAITGLINDQITNLTGTDATVLYTIYPGSTYCHGIPATCTITVHPLPVPIVSGNPTSCTGATGVVYSTETGKSNYLWSIAPAGTGTITTGLGTNSILVTWNAAGTHLVTVTMPTGVPLRRHPPKQ